MKTIFLAVALSLCSACAAIPECPTRAPEDKKDPSKVLAAFQGFLRCGELSKAHGLFSARAAEAIKFEPFYLAIQNHLAPDATMRVLLGFDQHSVKVSEDKQSAIARWCNREFGISREYRLVSQFSGRLWTIDFTQEQLEELLPAALTWFRKQREVADGRICAYPPDWEYANVMNQCPCLK